jgi:hypothetical protein
MADCELIAQIISDVAVQVLPADPE